MPRSKPRRPARPSPAGRELVRRLRARPSRSSARFGARNARLPWRSFLASVRRGRRRHGVARHLLQADRQGDQHIQHLRVGERQEERADHKAEQRRRQRLGELSVALSRAGERALVAAGSGQSHRQLTQALTASLLGFVVGSLFLSLAYSQVLYTLIAPAGGLAKVTVRAVAPSTATNGRQK